MYYTYTKLDIFPAIIGNKEKYVREINSETRATTRRLAPKNTSVCVQY